MVSNPPAADVSADSFSAAWTRALVRAGRLGRTLPLWLALAVGLLCQGTRGLQETSETRYAECAREMLVTGNWLEPSLDFQPHWTKPPFTYWAMAAGMKLCGVNAWGVRLPAVLALVLATWAVTAAGRRLGGAATGLAAGTAFALGFLPVAGANTATTDIYLCMAEALAGAAFLFAATESDVALRRRYAAAMWAAFGLAFLVKGPPGLLPLLAFLPWNFLQPRERRVPFGSPVGWLLFLAIGFGWYVAMLARHPDLLKYYVEREVVARIAADEGHNPEWYGGLTIYGPVLLLALGAPGLWALGLAFVRGGWARGARWKQLWATRDSRLLLVLWLALPLVVFSISKSKLHLYVLPLAAPLALMAGYVLARRASVRAFAVLAAVSLVFIVAAKTAYSLLPARRDMAALGREVQAVRAQLPPGHAVVVWDEPRNHGLTFYLGLQPPGLLERIAPEGQPKEKFERWTPAEFAARAAAGYPAGAVVIVGERKRADFDARFPGVHPAAERRGRYWHLLTLPAGAPIPAIHP